MRCDAGRESRYTGRHPAAPQRGAARAAGVPGRRALGSGRARLSPAPHAEQQRPHTARGQGRGSLPPRDSGAGSLGRSPAATWGAVSGNARGDRDSSRQGPLGRRAGVRRLQPASLPVGGRRERSLAAAPGSHSVGTAPPSGFGPRLTLSRSAARLVPSPLPPQLPRPRPRRRCLGGIFRNCAGAAFRDGAGSARPLPLCAVVRFPPPPDSTAQAPHSLLTLGG